MYFAAIASSRQSFLSNTFSFQDSFKFRYSNKLTRPKSICCKSPHHDDEEYLTGNMRISWRNWQSRR
ncbi:unnamed protein product [Brassica napus]|uniref:(rape) hypothetical protein n=1 Tax=Brassica napus TaxID=3708 RepID=A0A816KBU6_BRANA|nr:unnamed protein product [Brassica napus]